MSTQSPRPHLPLRPALGEFDRVEYVDFQNVGEHREFRFRAHAPDGPTDFRLRIAIAAFATARVRLQDGPDACYQKLLRTIVAGEAASAEVITVDDFDLATYREDHTPATKHRSWTPSPSATPAVAPRKPVRPPAPRLPVARVVSHTIAPAFEEGQRVSHAVFGVGVTTSSTAGHTVVRFDQDGTKTFVTSILKLELLSPPHTWETGPRGTNRPCPPLGRGAAADPSNEGPR